MKREHVADSTGRRWGESVEHGTVYGRQLTNPEEMTMRRSTRAATILSVTAVTSLAVAFPLLGSGGIGGTPAIPVIHPTLFAAAPSGATKPDDITKLGDLLYVTYRNNAGNDGTPAGSTSTIVAFDQRTGAVRGTYILPGRCDGLTADPEHNRLLASVNEDLNSSLFVIRPGNPVARQYTYSPSPAQTGSDGTNGGTDSIAVSPDGTIYIAHSNPDVSLPAPNNTAAVYKVSLHGDTAKLRPVFGVNDLAEVINPAPNTPPAVALGLTDPDSNRFLPGRHDGTLIQVSQADSKLVFATGLDSHHVHLRQLNLTNAAVPSGGPATPQLDDIEQATGRGVLYAVDQTSGNIYAFSMTQADRGIFFVSQPAPSAGDLPNDPAIGVVNVQTGVVTHVDSTLQSPKGLLIVPSGHRHHGA
jgi:hypothetical protein